MRRSSATVVLVCTAVGAAACGGPEVDEDAGAEALAAGETVPVTGPLWTATDYFTSRDEPSALPQTVAGTVNLVFGDSSAAGSTGCAEFQAEITFLSGDEESTADKADAVVFDDTEFRDVGDECAASSRVVHEDLVEFYSSGARLELSRRGTTELVLTSTKQSVDAPSLRFAAL